jgi:hypothetical protein
MYGAAGRRGSRFGDRVLWAQRQPGSAASIFEPASGPSSSPNLSRRKAERFDGAS